VLKEIIEDAKASGQGSRAMAILSLMVGPVTLSRIAEDETLSKGILSAAAAEIRRIARGDGAA
jgi:TetR/AcrR family transcriptional repressor of nem operon